MPNDKGQWTINRRDLMRGMAASGLMLAFPWAGSAHAFLLAPKPPIIPFKPSTIGEGVIGPYGEVRIFAVGGEILPIYASAFDGSAIMDLSGRTPFIRYGAGTTAITLSTKGVQIGSDKPMAWSGDTVKRLIEGIVKDRTKVRSVLLLRSALHSSYPVAAAKSKSQPKGGVKKSASAMSKGSQGFGAGAMKCVTTTITDTVTRTVTETIEKIKTVEQQYQECYDQQITRDPCKALGFGAGACAATVCAAIAFVEIVVGFVEVVTTITEEVTRQAVTCVSQVKFEWPNPWVVGLPVKAAVPQPAAAFGPKEIEGALKLLKDIGGFLGPFGKCLIEGQWSLAQATTPLDFGDGPVTIPYGVKVCITAACATQLSIDSISAEYLSAWGAALAALAALSPEFAAAVSGLGITAAPAVVAAIAALPEIVIAAAAIILAFIILALIYGTAISGQLFYHRHYTENFADGVVCIEHPSFALGLIKLATIGALPVELIPPIVTG
jgi:hypothetical protein